MGEQDAFLIYVRAASALMNDEMSCLDNLPDVSPWQVSCILKWKN